MARGIMYLFHCPACEVYEDRQVPYEERDNQNCITCQGHLERRITAPNSPRASYVDGQRAKSGTWKDMREASKLNVDAAGASPNNKKEIAREIRRLRVDIRK